MKLVECVPNFSSSDNTTIEQIVKAINEIEHAKVLHIDLDKDYNRTVITFIAHQNSIIDASFAAIETATETIDMTKHKGEHPRLGATDVFPLVPLQDSTFEECVILSRQLAEKVGTELSIPVYCYGKAALTPDRIVLSDIRRGQYEKLPQKLSDPNRKPDYGPATFVPKTGACVIGVRNFLIAYNVNLTTDDVKIANEISRRIRTSGWTNPHGVKEPGYLNGVQAIGISLHRENRGDFVQVSTNVLDYREKDSIHDVYEAVKTEASDLNTQVTGSEIVGLVPLNCLQLAIDYYNIYGENAINLCIKKLGLNDLYEFNPDLKILDRHISRWIDELK